MTYGPIVPIEQVVTVVRGSASDPLDDAGILAFYVSAKMALAYIMSLLVGDGLLRASDAYLVTITLRDAARWN